MLRVRALSLALFGSVLLACGPEEEPTTPTELGSSSGTTTGRDAGVPSQCTPECGAKVCDSNGCGGSCGGCASGTTCTSAGQCVAQCAPSCTGKTCGDDGCGGSCGACGASEACSEGACVCVPQCDGKTCGPNGCGGTCGICPDNSTCSATQDSCSCNSGYVPNKELTACVKVGDPCGTISTWGYCSGDSWVRCDPVKGVMVMGCGAGNCKTVDAQGTGACRCGSITSDGVCANADGSNGKETLFACLTGYDILTADNCAAETGNANGFCSTLVTSFGWATACFCSPCQWDDGNSCSQACSGGSCSYNTSGNYHTCN